MVKLTPVLVALTIWQTLMAPAVRAEEIYPEVLMCQVSNSPCQDSAGNIVCSYPPIDYTDAVLEFEVMDLDSGSISLAPDNYPVLTEIQEPSTNKLASEKLFSPASTPPITNINTPGVANRTITATPTPTLTPTSIPTPTPTVTQTPTATPTQLPIPTMTPAAADTQPTTGKPPSLDTDTIFTLINQHRQNLNLPAFEKEPQLCQLAEARGPEMYEEIFGDKYVHQGLYDRKLPYRIVENMVHRQSEQVAFNWWLGSSLHRRAIESDYKYSCGACWGNSCLQLFTDFQPK